MMECLEWAGLALRAFSDCGDSAGPWLDVDDGLDDGTGEMVIVLSIVILLLHGEVWEEASLIKVDGLAHCGYEL